MTRIGDAGQALQLQQQMLRIQERTADTQRQISTGYKSENYAGLGSDAGALLGAQSLLSRIDTQKSLANEVKTRLDFTEGALDNAASVTQNLRDQILKVLSTGDGTGLMIQADSAFSQFSAAMNQQFNGQYLFAGGGIDTAPVTVASLTDLMALPSAADAFNNGTLQSQAVLEDGATFTYGARANEVGTSMMTAIKDIAEFNAGVDGPFAAELTPAQRAFLEGQLATLSAAQGEVQTAVSSNGIAQARLEDIVQRQDAQKVLLKTFIGDAQDADMAEAISRLNQDQVALQAAYKMLGDLGQTSLLDFI